jgi:uncharacterized protein (DUF2141 family)
MTQILRGAATALILLVPAGFAAAQTAPACDPANAAQVRLQVTVSGMRSGDGNMVVTIYPDDPAHFLDGKYKLARQTVPVTRPTTKLCFAFDKPGFYAVALFDDENANGHLDTNFLGIPTEGAGFSRNPTLYVGPPDLGQVRIEAHAGDNPVPVELKYY